MPIANRTIGEIAHVARYANPTPPLVRGIGIDVQYLGATFIFMGSRSLMED